MHNTITSGINIEITLSIGNHTKVESHSNFVQSTLRVTAKLPLGVDTQTAAGFEPVNPQRKLIFAHPPRRQGRSSILNRFFERALGARSGPGSL